MFTKSLAEHDADAGEENEGKEVGFEFFIAGGDSAELLEFVKETFDFVALFVALLVVEDDLQAVGFGWDDRCDALGVELGMDRVAVVGFVHGGPIDSLPWLKVLNINIIRQLFSSLCFAGTYTFWSNN